MTIYADTSFLLSYNVRQDQSYTRARDYYERHQDEIWAWSPWHRVEVFNSIRQLTLHPNRKRRLRKAEAKALIWRVEHDVRVGYFTHQEADWRDVLRTASEISAGHSLSLSCRSADLLHVAYAKELGADLMVGFDTDQLALADAVGLKTCATQLDRS